MINLENFIILVVLTIVLVMFTLYRIVKQSVAENVLDRASVHTRNTAVEAVAALEQYCSAPLLKVDPEDLR